MEKATTVRSLKPTPELDARLTAIHERLKARNPDSKVSGSDLLRRVITRGCEALEAELDEVSA